MSAVELAGTAEIDSKASRSTFNCEGRIEISSASLPAVSTPEMGRLGEAERRAKCSTRVGCCEASIPRLERPKGIEPSTFSLGSCSRFVISRVRNAGLRSDDADERAFALATLGRAPGTRPFQLLSKALDA